LENLKGRDHLVDLATDGRMILKCVLRKKVRELTRYGPVAGSCEHVIKPSVSIKGGEFLD
jgi:hypothetical protein